MRVILASQSKIRTELLSMINIEHEVIVSNAEEILEEKLTLEEQAKKLAYCKAKKVFDETVGDRIVIGADTTVYFENKIIGKPKDEKDAFEILKKLQGATHCIITGLAILISDSKGDREYITYDLAKVTLKNMEDKEIREWIKNGKPFDKTAGYEIYSEFAKHIEKIEGHFSTIQGLPVHKVYDIIKEI